MRRTWTDNDTEGAVSSWTEPGAAAPYLYSTGDTCVHTGSLHQADVLLAAEIEERTAEVVAMEQDLERSRKVATAAVLMLCFATALFFGFILRLFGGAMLHSLWHSLAVAWAVWDAMTFMRSE